MVLSTNLADDFPELNEKEVKNQAQRWAERFPDVPITKVTLHHVKSISMTVPVRKSSWYKALVKEDKERINALRYVVVFDVDFVDENLNKADLTHDEVMGRVQGKTERPPYYELIDATGQNSCFPDPDIMGIFFDSDFKSVYKKEPRDDEYTKEWCFIAMAKNTDRPTMLVTSVFCLNFMKLF